MGVAFVATLRSKLKWKRARIFELFRINLRLLSKKKTHHLWRLGYWECVITPHLPYLSQHYWCISVSGERIRMFKKAEDYIKNSVKYLPYVSAYVCCIARKSLRNTNTNTNNRNAVQLTSEQYLPANGLSHILMYIHLDFVCLFSSILFLHFLK